MTEKVTEMKLKVDLQCHCCYKKVKKILCKFPEIRDQVYDEKNNTVKITVVCYCPEKIRDKICCKGRKVIQSIEIVVPPPKKEPEKKEEPKKDNGKTKGPEKKNATDKHKDEKPPPAPEEVSIQIGVCCPQCNEGHPGGPCYKWYGMPVLPPPCYDHYSYQYYYGYPMGRYGCRCCYCIDENPSACLIM